MAGALTGHLSWRLVFLGLPPFIALGVLLLLPALRSLPQTAGAGLAPIPGAAFRRTVPALAAAAGLVLLLYAGQRLDLVALGLCWPVPCCSGGVSASCCPGAPCRCVAACRR